MASKQTAGMQDTKEQRNWNWLRSISRNLYALDSKPLLGEVPPFAWDSFSEELRKTLGISSLSLRTDSPTWKEANSVVDGVKGPLICFSLDIQTVEKRAYLLANKDDLNSIMCTVLKLDPAALNAVPEDFFTSFYQFTAAVAANCFNKQELGKKAPVHLGEEEQIPSEPMLCQDIWVSCDDRTFLIRLALPKEFQESFSAFTKTAFSLKASPKLDMIEVQLSAEVGRTYFTLREWKTVQCGDFIQIDHLFYDPSSDKTQCIFSLAGKPIFTAKPKEGGFKILEIPLYNEVYAPMADKITTGQNKGSPPSNDEDPFAEDPFAEEELTEEEDYDIQEAEEEPAAIPRKKTEPKKSKEPEAPAHVTAGGKVGMEDISVALVVELATIETTVKQLLEMQPGNFIDIGVSPQNAVQLTINGRIIGSGELLRIGETLGVRILELGPT